MPNPVLRIFNLMRTRLISVAIGLALTSCSDAGDNQPITMSVIGSKLQLADPNRGPIGKEAALMLGATAQGLVAFDADGQIEPAIASMKSLEQSGTGAGRAQLYFKLGKLLEKELDRLESRRPLGMARAGVVGEELRVGGEQHRHGEHATAG